MQKILIVTATLVAACGSSSSPVDVDAGGTYYADAGSDAPGCTLAPPAQHACSLQYAPSTAYVCAATSSPPGLECMYLPGEQNLPDGSPWIVCCYAGSGS